MTATPARRTAARVNGRKGGRPRLFAEGTRLVNASLPEVDARLLDLVAIRRGCTPGQVVARAVWRELEAEGFPVTWGIPDSDRVNGTSTPGFDQDRIS